MTGSDLPHPAQFHSFRLCELTDEQVHDLMAETLEAYLAACQAAQLAVQCDQCGISAEHKSMLETFADQYQAYVDYPRDEPDLATCLEPDRHWPDGENTLARDWCTGCGACALCHPDTCPGHDGVCPGGQP